MKAEIFWQSSIKMERVSIFVLVALATSTAAADDTTTLDELFAKQFGGNILQISIDVWTELSSQAHDDIRSRIEPFPENVTWLPLTNEILHYLVNMQYQILAEFASDLGNVTLQTICQDLNDHCAEDLETPIEDLTVELSNVTCVIMRLRNWLATKLTMALKVGLQEFSRACVQRLELPLCSAVPANCTLAYQERTGKLLGDFIQDANEVVRVSVSTPLEIIEQFVYNTVDWVSKPHSTATYFLTMRAFLISTVPSIDPLSIENLVRPRTNKDAERAFLYNDTSTQSQEQLSWGIVRSDAGTVNLPCSTYRDVYPRTSDQYSTFLHDCYFVNAFQSNLDLLHCAYTDLTSTPLAWSTVPSAYFNSQCLCLTYNGTVCGVKAPHSVDPQLYCFSVLLRDFQRQVSYRPAVTYLDYASQTRVPVCQFTNFLIAAIKTTCEGYRGYINFPFILSVQCFFNGLVNKKLNCSETQLVNNLKYKEICAIQLFMDFVFCDDDVDVEVYVPYRGPGGSTLVLVLTYLEVAVRVFTLVTYLACPELRNLPGKLLIGYQVTALLRILVVRASLEDLTLAVRLDVATDLASTLWLTSYLHFLTESIKALRLPDSLSPAEALMVLLRYAVLGWALPVVLSAAFFSMDEALDTRVQFGQLLFVLCNFVALFGNIFMFIQNCLFYHDIKSGAIKLRKDAGARSVFVDLFIFALKTSLLSGAGITFRLVFTQIQGLEHLLGYYHALSTLQGLLFFVLYGCNREGRAFWKLVVFKSLPQCSDPEITSP